MVNCLRKIGYDDAIINLYADKFIGVNFYYLMI